MEDLNVMRDEAIQLVIDDLESKDYTLSQEAKEKVKELVEQAMLNPIQDSQDIAGTADYIEELLIDKGLIQEP